MSGVGASIGVAPVAAARAPPGLRGLFGFFLLGCGLSIICSAFMIGPVLHGELATADSYMRLVRIREMLTEGRLVQAVANDGSGAGTLLHWSHLLDGLLVLLSLPLRPFLGGEAALFWAAALSGPISVGVLGACCAWAVAPLAMPGFLFLAPVAVALAHGTINYGMLGEAHHHILVLAIAALVAGCAGRAAAGDVRAGAALGVVAALGIWLTPETMPFILMGFGAVGLAWVVGARPAPGEALARAGLVFAAGIAGTLLIDPPAAGYFAAEIDRLSGVYLALGVAVPAIGIGLRALDRTRLAPLARALAGLALTAVALGVWLALFPKVLQGPDGLMTPEQTAAFNRPVREMQPITRLADLVIFLVPGLLAFLAAAGIAVARRSLLSALLWGYAALCILVCLVLGRLHYRFTPYGQVAAAMLLPIVVSIITDRLGDGPPWRPIAARLGTVVLVVLAPWMGRFASAEEIRPPPNDAPLPCALRETVAMLRPYAGEVVLATVHDTPELLYRTQLRTVGSLYHRNAAAYMRLRAAWMSLPSADVPEAVRATGAAYVLACRGRSEPLVLGDAPEETLMMRLARGEVPAWLEPVAESPASGYVLYRIRQ